LKVADQHEAEALFLNTVADLRKRTTEKIAGAHLSRQPMQIHHQKIEFTPNIDGQSDTYVSLLFNQITSNRFSHTNRPATNFPLHGGQSEIGKKIFFTYFRLTTMIEVLMALGYR
jgi:hypothetical protein